MRVYDIFKTLEGGGIDYGSPKGTFLAEALDTEAGKKTLLYILVRLGYFSSIDSDGAAAVHNAAMALLNDITEQTGFSLEIGLIR